MRNLLIGLPFLVGVLYGVWVIRSDKKVKRPLPNRGTVTDKEKLKLFRELADKLSQKDTAEIETSAREIWEARPASMSSDPFPTMIVPILAGAMDAVGETMKVILDA